MSNKISLNSTEKVKNHFFVYFYIEIDFNIVIYLMTVLKKMLILEAQCIK